MADSETTGGFVPPQLGSTPEKPDRPIPIDVGTVPVEQSTPSIVKKLQEMVRTGNWNSLFTNTPDDRE